MGQLNRGILALWYAKWRGFSGEGQCMVHHFITTSLHHLLASPACSEAVLQHTVMGIFLDAIERSGFIFVVAGLSYLVFPRESRPLICMPKFNHPRYPLPHWPGIMIPCSCFLPLSLLRSQLPPLERSGRYQRSASRSCPGDRQQ